MEGLLLVAILRTHSTLFYHQEKSYHDHDDASSVTGRDPTSRKHREHHEHPAGRADQIARHRLPGPASR